MPEKVLWKKVKKQGSYSILKVWGWKKVLKNSFWHGTRVAKKIFANGFHWMVSFTVLHLGFHELLNPWSKNQANIGHLYENIDKAIGWYH